MLYALATLAVLAPAHGQEKGRGLRGKSDAYAPTYTPTYKPTYQPTKQPTYQPTYKPSGNVYEPTYEPTFGRVGGPAPLPHEPIQCSELSKEEQKHHNCLDIATGHVKVTLTYKAASLIDGAMLEDLSIKTLAAYLSISWNPILGDFNTNGRRLQGVPADMLLTFIITACTGAACTPVAEETLSVLATLEAAMTDPTAAAALQTVLDAEIAKLSPADQAALAGLTVTVTSAADTDQNGAPTVVDPDAPFTDTWFQKIQPMACEGLSAALQVEAPDYVTPSVYSLVEHFAGTGNTTFRKVFDIPGVAPNGARMNGFAMYSELARCSSTVCQLEMNNAAMIAVRTGNGAGVAQLCAFDTVELECYPELLKLDTLATAAAIVDNTYFYAAGDMREDETRFIYAVHDINTMNPEFDRTVVDPCVIDNSFPMFTTPNKGAGIFDFSELVEEPGQDDLVVDNEPGGYYLLATGTRYWHCTADQSNCAVGKFPAGGVEASLFVGRIDKIKMELKDYAILYQEMDASRRPGDPIAKSQFSHFGAAYTVRNQERNDQNELAPQRVYFSANSNQQTDEDFNVDAWWGRFGQGLGFSVPEDCWNSGSDISDDKECTYDNFPDATLPLTTLTWAGNSDRTNRNDGSNCQYLRDPTSAPSAAPSSSPTVVPTGPPSPEPTPTTTTQAPPTETPTTATPTETPTTATPTDTPTTATPTDTPTVAPTIYVEPLPCVDRPLQVLKPSQTLLASVPGGGVAQNDHTYYLVDFFDDKITNTSNFRFIFEIPELVDENGDSTTLAGESGQQVNGFAVHHAATGNDVVNTAYLAVQYVNFNPDGTPNWPAPNQVNKPSKAQLCSFDQADLKCWGKTLLTTELPTAASIITDTYFYAVGSFKSGADRFVMAVHQIETQNADFSEAKNVRMNQNMYCFYRNSLGVGNEAGVFDFTSLVEQPGKNDYVVDNVDGGIYLVGVCTMRWKVGATPTFWVANVDSDTMEVQKYAVLKNQIKGRSRREAAGYSTPRNVDMSHFGAAYTVNTLQPEKVPEVFFSANSNYAGLSEAEKEANDYNKPEYQWGQFKLTLPISVPDVCWNEGRKEKNHKSCILEEDCPVEQGVDEPCYHFKDGDLDPNDVPTVTIGWQGSSDQTNFNDGAHCLFESEPTANPTVFIP